MSAKVGFHPDARRELREAADFYERERHGLGIEFLTEVERAVSRVAEYPQSSPVVMGDVRTCAMARFPYAIMYSERDGHVYVSAIAHSGRRPFYWRSRL